MLAPIKVKSVLAPKPTFGLKLSPYLDLILENRCRSDSFPEDYSFYLANSCILRVKDSGIVNGDCVYYNYFEV